MRLRALETVFWPGINKDITKQYQSCKTCIKQSKSQPREPLQPHLTPEIPWHTVATDMFELRNSKYLLIVDCYSRFPVLHKLACTTARALIQEMKAVFAELGVPSIIVSDGGPQYTSVEFKDFMKQWQIEHRVSSPRHPQSKKDCPEQVLEFWDFRQEISEENGILYKSHRLIVPHSERLETLKVLHMGHYAIEKMQLRALETVFWPGINKDITKQYHSCKACIKHSKSQPREPLQPHPMPEIPWHTVATDLFELRNSKYLLIVDYYSRFPVLHKLASTTARALIQEMKAVFAELGVPSVIVSDGGPQYTSVEFKDFMKQWQIEHRVSSPRHPQSNGMAERHVQTMKASLIKTMEEGEDIDLALLTYKATPLSHNHQAADRI